MNAKCPVYLDLYDGQGRCVGYNETSGIVEDQIPGVLWVSNQTLIVVDPSGTYEVKVTGTGNGTYELETFFRDLAGITSIVSDLNGTITENEMQTYSFGASANVTLTSILPSKTVVGQGFNMQVNATVADLGGPNATFDIVMYANETTIGSQRVLDLSGWNSTTAWFAWNTTGLAYGNYTVSANILPANNNLTGGTVEVSIPGDINGDGAVDITTP